MVGFVVGEGDVESRPAGWNWRGWLEWMAIAMLAAGAVIGPLVLGGTTSLARVAINLLVAGAAVAWCVARPRSWRLMCLPLAVTALAMLQLLPLPGAVLQSVAPYSAQLWMAANGGILPAWGTISVDAGVTMVAIRQVFLGLAAFVVVADLCRDGWRRLFLAGSIALVGGLIWGLALAFPMNEKHVLLGRFSLMSVHGPSWRTSVLTPDRTAGFDADVPEVVTVGDKRYTVRYWAIGDGIGSYVVSNHFAAGMYLTLPLLVGLFRERLRGRVWGWGGAVVSLVVLLAATRTVGFQAHSRAGMGAMLLATVVFMALSSRSWLGRWFWGLTTCAAVAGLSLIVAAFFGCLPGFPGLLPDGIRERAVVALKDGRLQLTHVAFSLCAVAPLLGTGLGTYGVVQPHMAPKMPRTYFTHNDYAQMLAEGGVVAGVVMVGLALVLVAGLVRCWRAPEEERCRDAGAWAALAAIGLHSFFDWNMHVPGNALLTCLVAGLAMAGVIVGDEERPGRWSLRRICPAALLVTACLVAALLSVRDMTSESAARRLRYALLGMRTATTDDERAIAMGRLEHASALADPADRWNPNHVELAVLASQAALHLAADGDDASAETADAWMKRARARSPLPFGLPEPLPGGQGK